VRAWRGKSATSLLDQPTIDPKVFLRDRKNSVNVQNNKNRTGSARIRATQPVIVYEATENNKDQLKTLHVPINQNQAVIKGKINDVNILILLDTGTRGEYIHKDSQVLASLYVRPLVALKKITLFDGSPTASGPVTHQAIGSLSLHPQYPAFDVALDITALSDVDVVLGQDWMQKHNIVLDFKRNRLELPMVPVPEVNRPIKALPKRGYTSAFNRKRHLRKSAEHSWTMNQAFSTPLQTSNQVETIEILSDTDDEERSDRGSIIQGKNTPELTTDESSDSDNTIMPETTDSESFFGSDETIQEDMTNTRENSPLRNHPDNYLNQSVNDILDLEAFALDFDKQEEDTDLEAYDQIRAVVEESNTDQYDDFE